MNLNRIAKLQNSDKKKENNFLAKICNKQVKAILLKENVPTKTCEVGDKLWG